MVELVKKPALGFSSGRDLRAVTGIPASGSLLGVESA